MAARRTFLLVDGENIDATLGASLFQRRPQPDERPRWERLTSYAETEWHQPATGLFFLNATNGQTAFNAPLPRTRVISLADFDPERFLL